MHFPTDEDLIDRELAPAADAAITSQNPDEDDEIAAFRKQITSPHPIVTAPAFEPAPGNITTMLRCLDDEIAAATAEQTDLDILYTTLQTQLCDYTELVQRADATGTHLTAVAQRLEELERIKTQLLDLRR
jgi:hypothetical protein